MGDLKDKLKNNQFNGGQNGQSENLPVEQNNQKGVENKQPKSVFDFIQQMQPQIEKALPKHITSERLTRIILTAIRNNPQLQNCDAMSLMGAIMTSAQLGLEPNTPLGQAYLIPYNSKSGLKVQFQLGYKGVLDLAYRSGEYKMIYAIEVYPNDKFSYEYGLYPELKHIPDKSPEGEPIFYYAAYQTKNGGSNFRVWSREKVIKHMNQYSKSVQSHRESPWDTNFDMMAKKTVLIDLLKYAPKSVEMARFVESDSTIKTDISENMLDVDEIYD